ncbi:TetR/AcrR family transcriptional regulator [Cytophagales bacterium LB-30]|uniref:TetR/AcrR family transcriptional regulator n=1 Tax=Shiella aurantiaca TaxID=3058365 RepID=A0ABT8F0N6_9BACT|nr:TetR/AcrR family transcriptional regulator [Shiella aurantiaca]MDN4164007.1 TetR/AcrR family transcriptional regulator [Shiella aurantiaca]
MRNPTQTKESILESSGKLFNTQGYKATSISDITDATGLTKGAIYRHFDSKQHLEEETLAHLANHMFEGLRSRIKMEASAPGKLHAICDFYKNYLFNTDIEGGCPLLNAAIEADDANPGLKTKAIGMLDMLMESLISIIQKGIEHRQIKPSVDPQFIATIFIGALEGGIMMSKLRSNSDDINRIIQHLETVIYEISL